MPWPPWDRCRDPRCSGCPAVYETEPFGNADQPKFLNAAVELETSLEPMVLLKSLQRVEHHMGRVRQVKWEPRVIDLDILYFGSQVIDTPELKVPHPELSLRGFVLVPLCDLIPDFEDPGQPAEGEGPAQKNPPDQRGCQKNGDG